MYLKMPVTFLSIESLNWGLPWNMTSVFVSAWLSACLHQEHQPDKQRLSVCQLCLRIACTLWYKEVCATVEVTFLVDTCPIFVSYFHINITSSVCVLPPLLNATPTVYTSELWLPERCHSHSQYCSSYRNTEACSCLLSRLLLGSTCDVPNVYTDAIVTSGTRSACGCPCVCSGPHWLGLRSDVLHSPAGPSCWVWMWWWALNGVWQTCHYH